MHSSNFTSMLPGSGIGSPGHIIVVVGMRGDDVPQIVRVVQQVALELRRLALNEVTVGFVGVVPRMQGRYRLVLPYAAKNAAAPAIRSAWLPMCREFKARSIGDRSTTISTRSCSTRSRGSARPWPTSAMPGRR